MCLSATEAADVHTECTWPCLESRSEGFSLSLISTVAPHLALLAVQQIRQHVLVRYRSRRRAHRMHMALLGVHSDVCLQPEVPLLSLARLMHLRIALWEPALLWNQLHSKSPHAQSPPHGATRPHTPPHLKIHTSPLSAPRAQTTKGRRWTKLRWDEVT